MNATDYQALHAHLLDMLGAKDHRDAARIIGEHHARELHEREVGGTDKPAAWLIPRIVTFSGVVRTSCHDHLRLELEGTVAWEASLIGDAPPVTDKHGVTHHAAPLYTAPRAAVPDGWKLVPVEPTEAMIVAGGDASASDGMETDVWDAMLAAAPEVMPKAATYQWPSFEVVQKWALENGYSGASDDEAYRAYRDAHPQVVSAEAVEGDAHG